MFNGGRARVMLVEEEITLEVQSWKSILEILEIILEALFPYLPITPQTFLWIEAFSKVCTASVETGCSRALFKPPHGHPWSPDHKVKSQTFQP